MISVLSKPIRGRKTGREHTAFVQVRPSMVWLATWPMDSPVTRAWQRVLRATRSAMRIMNRRMRTVSWLSGHFW